MNEHMYTVTSSNWEFYSKLIKGSSTFWIMYKGMKIQYKVSRLSSERV